MQWLSVIPALATIIITFKTKKLVPALLTGIVIGALLNAKSVIDGITSIGNYVVEVLSDKGSAYALIFLILYGSLSELISMAGGIAGFSKKLEKRIKSERGVLGWSWGLSLPTFFNSSFHFIAVGTVMNPFLDKVKASKEKFAFILSVTSLQLILLIPVASANIGYMVSLVATNIKNSGMNESAYEIVVKSILWNFFSWSMVLLALGVTFFSLGFGKIKLGKAKNEELTQGHIEKEKNEDKQVEEYPQRAMNLIVPVAILIMSTLFLFWWTGRGASSSLWGALSNADFSVSIFAGAFISIILSGIFYLFQKISLAEIQAHIVKGGEKVIALVIILLLSWVLTRITQDLGFNNLINQNLIADIPKLFVPAILFLISGAISYTIGSSWATWALMMPLAAAFSAGSGIDIAIMAGTVWAGGAVTDVVSPISAEMANIPYGKHFITALPYVVVGVVISTIGYIVAGFLLR
jgi:Na+/H+ antiporter NhaC